MTALPDDVSAALVRAMGAYIRAVPAAELPPKLKRFKHLDRPRALTPHKDALLGILDGDRLTRGRISEWMADGKPSLSKGDRELLALAVDRPDGWAEALAACSAKESPKPAGQRAPRDEGELLERAKERTAKAREEARRARAGAATATAEADKRVAQLERELKEARAESGSLRRAVGAAEERVAAAERKAARVDRKARGDKEAAAEKEKALRGELKAVRRELRGATQRLAREDAPRAPATPRRPPSADPPPRRRPRLPVPKGRLQTDPETLDAWLDVDDVHLLVDGYNVAKAEGGFGDVDLPAQRRLLIEAVGKLARKKKVPATIVFDGSVVPPGTSRRPKGPVVVEYSRPGEIADDHLIARLESIQGVPVVVATNDKELQHRAAAVGATVATSNQLLALIR